MSRKEISEEGRANIRAAAQKERTCPHCGAAGKGPTMFRHHFARCPKKPVSEGERLAAVAVLQEMIDEVAPDA